MHGYGPRHGGATVVDDGGKTDYLPVTIRHRENAMFRLHLT